MKKQETQLVQKSVKKKELLIVVAKFEHAFAYFKPLFALLAK